MSEPVCSVCCKKESEQDAKLQRCSRCRERLYCGQACQANDWPTHKTSCQRPNYLLQVRLRPDDIVDPPVSRILNCPAAATFDDLHKALQIAFGWSSTHCYDFTVKDAAREAERDAADKDLSWVERISRGETPFPTRAWPLRIVDRSTGDPLTRGVDGMHERMRKDKDTPERSAQKTKLCDVFDKAEYQDKVFEYMYDWGDSWCHDIKVLERKPWGEYFTCVDGEGHGVAEDAGNVEGWKEVLAAYRTEHPTQEQKEKRLWFEREASNADRRGLAGGKDREWSKEAVNRNLLYLQG